MPYNTFLCVYFTHSNLGRYHKSVSMFARNCVHISCGMKSRPYFRTRNEKVDMLFHECNSPCKLLCLKCDVVYARSEVCVNVDMIIFRFANVSNY